MTGKNSKCRFEKLEDKTELTTLLKLLTKRLPTSCFVANQLKAFQQNLGEFGVYTYESHCDKDVSPEASLWILVTEQREDWGTIVSLSAPETWLVTDDVKDALENSHFMDWDEPFVFLSQNEALTDFVVKTQIHKRGNITKIYPTHMFWMPPEEALKLDVSVPDNVELKPLDIKNGVNFLTTNWPHTRQGTKEYLERQVSKFGSGGVYVKGCEEPASVAIFPSFGILSCLGTHPDHRRKGYASMVTKYVYKEAAEKGFYPCLDTDMSDKRAVGFHTSFTGNKIIGKLYYVCHKTM